MKSRSCPSARPRRRWPASALAALVHSRRVGDVQHRASAMDLPGDLRGAAPCAIQRSAGELDVLLARRRPAPLREKRHEVAADREFDAMRRAFRARRVAEAAAFERAVARVDHHAVQEAKADAEALAASPRFGGAEVGRAQADECVDREVVEVGELEADAELRLDGHRPETRPRPFAEEEVGARREPDDLSGKGRDSDEDAGAKPEPSGRRCPGVERGDADTL